MRSTRRLTRAETPARIEMDDELLALRAQAEGRAVFQRDEFYERIHERASEDSKSIWKLTPGVRLKFQFYMAARNRFESLKEEVVST